MSEAPHIIVVDDEAEVREMIEDILGAQGFSVATAADGAQFRALLEERPADLCLLDIRLPGEDGLSLARFVREHHDMGIIMVTASGDVIDRVIGLEIGADDYVAKPFDPRELLARVKSVLRRLSSRTKASKPGSAGAAEVRFGRCILNLEAHTLRTDEGETIPITSMEFDLLRAFAENPNKVLTRDRLLDLAHNREWEPFDRSIDIRIARLRRKIEPDPAKPETIKTIRGSGYMFVPSRGP